MSGDHNMYSSGSGDGQRSGWRKRTIMEMARECGIPEFENNESQADNIIRFAELVREDEAEKYKWDVHSCGPTCTKVACVATREAVQAEREACAKVCDEYEEWCGPWGQDDNLYAATESANEIAKAIRARGQA